jgi:hypothetical protein
MRIFPREEFLCAGNIICTNGTAFSMSNLSTKKAGFSPLQIPLFYGKITQKGGKTALTAVCGRLIVLGAAVGTVYNTSFSNPLMVCITPMAKYIDYCFGKVQDIHNAAIPPPPPPPPPTTPTNQTNRPQQHTRT